MNFLHTHPAMRYHSPASKEVGIGVLVDTAARAATDEFCGFLLSGTPFMAAQTGNRKVRQLPLRGVTGTPTCLGCRPDWRSSGSHLSNDTSEAIMATSSASGKLAHTFTYANFRDLRIIERDGEPWFVAVDVCAALELDNITNALKRLDADEATLISIKGRTPTGGEIEQSINIINESGLYSLILTSRKPEAKKFKKWVTSEVLPAIRKTGAYVASNAPQATTTPTHVNEPLAANDMLNIKRMIWMLAHGFRFERVWSSGIWFYLRQALALPSPQPFCVDHLPRIAHELHTIAAASYKVQMMMISIEQEAARRIFRKGECADLVVNEMQAQATKRLDDMQKQLATLPAYLQSDMNAITNRTRAMHDHGNDEQPDYFKKVTA